MGARQEHMARINRVLDYIAANLDGDLSLAALARVACFSPYHFHRVFAAAVGETISRYVQRLRLERAANRLIYNPELSITEVALECGFSGSAAFARAFSEYYGMSASAFREGGYRELSKICKKDHKKRKDYRIETLYADGKHQQWRITMQAETIVEVKTLEPIEVAYLRHIGPYQGDGELFGRLFGRLMGWAGPRGLLAQPDFRCLSVYQDNERLTDDDKLQLCVCISVPAATAAEGEIGRMQVPGGAYAVGCFELSEAEYQEAWDLIMGEWLPQSGYQTDDRPCLEFYLNNPEEHPENKHIVEICVPVRPL